LHEKSYGPLNVLTLITNNPPYLQRSGIVKRLGGKSLIKVDSASLLSLCKNRQFSFTGPDLVA